jgi:hypothetical protein
VAVSQSRSNRQCDATMILVSGCIPSPMKATRVPVEDLQHKAAHLVGRRLSSGRRTVFDWASGV